MQPNKLRAMRSVSKFA